MMCHLIFEKSSPVYFSEANPPRWLTGDAYGWWWKGHVLKLEVGDHIDSDFQRITCIGD